MQPINKLNYRQFYNGGIKHIYEIEAHFLLWLHFSIMQTRQAKGRLVCLTSMLH